MERAMPTGLSRRQFFLSGVCAAALSPAALAEPRKRALPNIVVIYADDLGYGDIGCYGATRVKTPNLDRLAAGGLRMTNGHAPSATCTPSRYALLTGEYAWRQEGARILPGDAPALIAPGKPTLPAMLREAGYATGLVGKWHLGLGDGATDWNREIAPGPLEIGFDSAYFIPATVDRVPTVYIDGHRVVGLDPGDPLRVDYRQKVGTEPTGRENPGQLRMAYSDGHDGTIVDGVSRIGWMSGGKAARWTDEAMAEHLTGKAVAFMEAHRHRPFFLYFATNEIHVPRLPARRFQGSTGMGPRGDSIVELDWCVGEVMRALDRLGITENTLVLFSSDNGPVLDDGYVDGAVERLGAHQPAGPYRSGKYSIYDGGLKVPMIVRWPARIRAGRTSNALVDHVDLLASFATLTGQRLAPEAAVDSLDVLPALLGRTSVGRRYVIEDTNTAVSEKASLSKTGSSTLLALVEDGWKLVAPHGPATRFHGNDIGTRRKAQLFHVATDPGETHDLADAEPDRLEVMSRRLARLRANGRTRPV
jgi:arylsulfatase A-like enzyme